MITVMSDDLFTREVTNDPYTYFGRLRDKTRSTGTSCTSYGSSPATTIWSGSPGTMNCFLQKCSKGIPGPVPASRCSGPGIVRVRQGFLV